MMFFAMFLVCMAVFLVQLQAMPPVSVVANVRGKKYEVTAETVEQFSAEVQTLTDIPADQQSVLFRGKVLAPSDKLEDVGVSAGEVLNVVKGRKAFKPAAMSSSSSSADDMLNSGKSSDEEMMKNMKMDPEQMKQMQQKIEQALDSEEMMSYFDDDEKMEQSRLETLANLDKYEKMMPGFSDKVREMAEDPVKWKEAMTQAKQQIMQLKNLKKSGGLPPAGAQSPLFTPSEAPTTDGR